MTLTIFYNPFGQHITYDRDGNITRYNLIIKAENVVAKKLRNIDKQNSSYGLIIPNSTGERGISMHDTVTVPICLQTWSSEAWGCNQINSIHFSSRIALPEWHPSETKQLKSRCIRHSSVTEHEDEDNIIHSSMIKTLTGNDSVYLRELYKKSEVYGDTDNVHISPLIGFSYDRSELATVFLMWMEEKIDDEDFQLYEEEFAEHHEVDGVRVSITI